MINQTAKQMAKQAATQIAREPLEILKTAREQIESQTQSQEQPEPQQQKPNEPTPEEKAKKAAQTQRLIGAYESEIEDIRKQDLFKDLQRRIAEGEDIPLSDYPELTLEQKQVLAAQKQAVDARRVQSDQAKETPLQVISKKGRKMFGKIGLKREQTKVEMRQPPSS